MSNEKEVSLLVTFNLENGIINRNVLEQHVLEAALLFNIIPYSSEFPNSILLKGSCNLITKLESNLKLIPKKYYDQIVITYL